MVTPAPAQREFVDKVSAALSLGHMRKTLVINSFMSYIAGSFIHPLFHIDDEQLCSISFNFYCAPKVLYAIHSGRTSSYEKLVAANILDAEYLKNHFEEA